MYGFWLGERQREAYRKRSRTTTMKQSVTFAIGPSRNRSHFLMLLTCPRRWVSYFLRPFAMGSPFMSLGLIATVLAVDLPAISHRRQTSSYSGTDCDRVTLCCVADCDRPFSGYQPACDNGYHILWDRLRYRVTLFFSLSSISKITINFYNVWDRMRYA